MRFLPEKIEKYSEFFSSKESDVLAELNRETNLNVMIPQMLSGHIQGGFLKMISFMLNPKSILEVGTFTGYSAICMAEGLTENGVLHTIDINAELEEICKKYFKKAVFENQIIQHIGNALDIIPTIEGTFDLVFLDADKINYTIYYDLLIDRVRKGGFIIADNVLWSGKVVEKIKSNDKDTLALHRYNEMVNNDPRVENYLLPIRDGLMIARKL